MSQYQFNSGEIKKSEVKIQCPSTFQQAFSSDNIDVDDEQSSMSDEFDRIFFDEEELALSSGIQKEYPEDYDMNEFDKSHSAKT